MSRKESSVLGIDLNEQEIRAVQIKYRSGRPYVSRAASVSTPVGAFSRGVVYEPAILAVALRRLLDSMRLPGPAKAVMGLSGDTVSFRNLSIPPCPESEIATLVAGEVEYQGLVHQDGTYDTVRLYPPNEDASSSVSLAVVSVADETTSALREVAEEAGIHIEAFEPIPFAILRTASSALITASNAFVLIVGTNVTEAAFFVNGRLASIRRIDVGTASLLQSYAASSSYDEPLDAARSAHSDLEPEIHIDQAAADRLTLEAQRTLEYLQREDPDATAIDCVYLAIPDAGLALLTEDLSQRLGVPAQLVTTPYGPGDVSDAAATMEKGGGLPFIAAYGLATHTVTHPGIVVPRVDLDSAHRTEMLRGENKRNFLGAIMVSVIAVCLGIIGGTMYNRQISRVEKRSKATLAEVASIRATTAKMMTERSDKETRYGLLRKEGVPLTAIMDNVIGSIDPAIGLKNVAITEDLRVRITGEALDEAGLVRATQNLQRSPVLADLMVNQFNRDLKTKSTVLTFELSGTTVSAERMKDPEKLVAKR